MRFLNPRSAIGHTNLPVQACAQMNCESASTRWSGSLGTSGIWAVEELFNRGPYDTGGGEDAVNATGWTAPSGYDVDWVPSMRMVVSLDDLDDSRWVNLTGASGHAFNSHYADQFDLWRNGETTPWPFSPQAVQDAAVEELRLVRNRRAGAEDGLG